MAYLLNSSDVYIGCEINTAADPIEFKAGRNVGSLPTLYNNNGEYIEPVNQWFIHLKAEKRLENLNSYARALKYYWSFLETEGLIWDTLPAVKALKPTYRFRNDELFKKIKTGKIAYSTANTYMSHLVQFYLWAAHERYFPITDNHKPFEIEFVKIKNNDILAHMKPKFVVQTTDLRIKVPRDSFSHNVHRLTPLSEQMLHNLSLHLCHTSIEVRLICLLAAQCGLRIEEASGLTLVALNQAVQRAGSRTHFELTIGPHNGVPTKYNKTRTIEITEPLLNELNRLSMSERTINRLNKLNTQIERYNNSLLQNNNTRFTSLNLNKENLELLTSAIQYEPLFISQQGHPYHPQTIGTRFGEIRRSLNRSGVTFNHRFHDLRCSYATYRLYSLLAAGLEPASALSLIMQWMGHKNESTSWKYLRYLKHKEALKEKISMLDSIMHQALQETMNE